MARLTQFQSGSPRFTAVFVALFVFSIQYVGITRPAIAQSAGARFEQSALSIHTRAGAVHKFKIEIARTAEQQALGLMYRRRLAADAGMLFLHQRSRRARMWMKNTFIPLDMIFVGANGRIVDLKQRTVPRSLAIITSRKSVIAVFEVNAGTVSRLGLAIGDRLVHPWFTPAK